MFISELVKLGLDEKQAKLYLACLELNEASVLELSQKTGIKRTSLYEILPTLIKHGIISKTFNGRKIKYVAESPLKLYRQKSQELDVISQLLPNLEALRNSNPKKPVIRWYDGREALQKVLEEMILGTSTNSEILAYEGRFNEMHTGLGQGFLKKLLATKHKQKLKSKTVIVAKKGELLSAIKKVPWSIQHPTELRLIDNDTAAVKVNLYLTSDQVIFIDPINLLALSISSKLFRDSLAFAFTVLWQNAIPLEKTI